MNVRIEKLDSLKLIGFQRIFTAGDAYAEIPKFWDEVNAKLLKPIWAGKGELNELEKAVKLNCVGEFGACIDDIGDGAFRYMIAGKFVGEEVPSGLSVYEFPSCEWAIFDCVGAMPKALQDANTKVFNDWLPNNPDYKLAMNANLEWYSSMPTDSPEYMSAIWLPILKK